MWLYCAFYKFPEVQSIHIDNQGSGYLGMARCFNVHRQLPVSKETVISQHRNILDKTRCTIEKSYF